MKLTPPTTYKNSWGSSPPPSSHMESTDCYDDVIVQVSHHCCVITCRDACQWIIQKKEAPHAGRWRGISYYRYRDNLLRACGSLNVLSATLQDQLLDALPSTFREYIAERSCS